MPEVEVADARAAMAPIAAALLRRPDRASSRVVGITGTNGKTTTAFLIREMLEAAGSRCGLLGTVKRVVGGGRGGGRADDARGDRPAGDVPARCSMPATRPARWRSPRTRSSLHRADAIHFDVEVFTNLTQDHLDFHSDMEDYFAAKRLLFRARAGRRW